MLVRAPPARRSAFTLSDRGESVSAVLDGFSTQSSLLFSFQGLKLLASRRSRRRPTSWRLKRPPFGGPGKRSQPVGRFALSAALDCQMVPRHQLKKYNITSPGVKPRMGDFLSASLADETPRAGLSTVLGLSASGIITPPRGASSGSPKRPA